MAKKTASPKKTTIASGTVTTSQAQLTTQEIVGIIPRPERISDLISQLEDGSLEPRPEFQRRLVWTDKHKRKFIETVLKRYPFPEIYIATVELNPATAKRKRILVDGQQRITTLRDYFMGEESLKLGNDVAAYEDLSEDEKTGFLDYSVTVRDLGQLRMETVKEIYRRINSTNYALNNMENLYAQFDGPFRQFCEWIADHSFFTDHDIFTDSDKSRMFDLNFAITFVISIVQGYPSETSEEESSTSSYPHRNEKHHTFLQKYNVNFPQEQTLRKEFELLVKKIEEFELPGNSRAWKQIDLLTLLVETHHAAFKDHIDINGKNIGKHLNSFYLEVDKLSHDQDSEHVSTKTSSNAMIYLKAATRASTDRYSRVERGKIIENILKRGAKS